MTGRVESRSHAELRGEFRLPALYPVGGCVFALAGSG